jgi:hypothetical protein
MHPELEVGLVRFVEVLDGLLRYPPWARDSGGDGATFE